MSVSNCKELMAHANHELEIAWHGPKDDPGWAAIECRTCHEPLVSFDKAGEEEGDRPGTRPSDDCPGQGIRSGQDSDENRLCVVCGTDRRPARMRREYISGQESILWICDNCVDIGKYGKWLQAQRRTENNK